MTTTSSVFNTHSLLSPTHPPLTSTLFPYTTLFRSGDAGRLGLTAEFSFGTDFARHARDFRGEAVQLVHHRINGVLDRKSTRLNSSHTVISYAVFCLKKKKEIF